MSSPQSFDQFNVDRERWAIALALRASHGYHTMAQTCCPAAFTSKVRSELYQSVVFGNRSLIELNDEFGHLERFQFELGILNRNWKTLGNHGAVDMLVEALNMLTTIQRLRMNRRSE